jgi:uncharacterized phiE125 gp8 family phage protein
MGLSELRPTLALVTGPASEPLTLQEVKDFAQIDTDAADDLLDLLIAAARRRVEEVTGRQLVTATYQLLLQGFPGDGIEIPRPPLLEVDWVKYYDTAGTIQTVDASVYEVITSREPGLIWLAYGEAWPIPRSQLNAVKIQFQAGYGDGTGTGTGGHSDGVPDDLKAAMLLWIKLRYDRRGEATPEGFDPDDLFRPWCWGDYR